VLHYLSGATVASAARRLAIRRLCGLFIDFEGIAERSLCRARVKPAAMSIASTIAVSGMNAAALRLQISASNVANVQSNGPLPDSANAGSYPPAYNALTVNQTAMPDGTTFATVTPVFPGTVKSWNPAVPYADAQGMVAAPNVDLANEAVQQMMAGLTYAANAAVVRADNQMTSALLNVLA
jgi:flagellar basal-body rod protein FlgC